jgi:hypothetical protein
LGFAALSPAYESVGRTHDPLDGIRHALSAAEILCLHLAEKTTAKPAWHAGRRIGSKPEEGGELDAAVQIAIDSPVVGEVRHLANPCAR